jgi:HSP20 family molecular chaperone IbpA
MERRWALHVMVTLTLLSPGSSVAETYLKVSFGAYLLELDLLRAVDEDGVKASAKHGVLTVRARKVGR